MEQVERTRGRRERSRFRNGWASTLIFLLLTSAGCARVDAPVLVSDIILGAADVATIPVFLHPDFVEGSLEITLDGQLLPGIARTLWGASTSTAVSGVGPHLVVATARFLRGGQEVTFSNSRSFANVAPTPALLSSTPARDATNVPRTAWMRLEFVSAVDAESASGVSLACLPAGGVAASQAVAVSGSGSPVLVVNPAGSLPGGAECVLSWRGPAGMEYVRFQTAGVGPVARVVYDRTDAGQSSPFPDDFWAVADATTRTGLRLDVPVPARPTDVQDIFGSILPDTRSLDGFSPIAHFVIELTDAVDPTSVPRTPAESLDPLASVGLFDLDPASPTFAERIPFRLEPRDDTTGGSAPKRSRTFLVFPSIPLSSEGRYGFVVTRRALVSPDRPFEPSAFFAAALAPAAPGEAPEIARVRALADDVLAVVGGAASPPIPRDDVALALRISVRSTDDIPNDLLAIRRDVFVDHGAPGVAITSVLPDTAGGASSPIAAIVRGTFDAPDYRSGTPAAPGANFVRDVAGLPVRQRTRPVSFTLCIPKTSLAGPAPVTMWQHGNPGSEDEVIGGARRSLAGAGFAVIGFTDILNREVAPPGVGDDTARITAQVVNILFAMLANDRLPDFWAETHAEQIAFVRVLETITSTPALADLVPIGAPDGIPDMSLAAPRTYVGISEGANNGPGFLAYAPEFKAAALVVGGARLAEVLIHQQAATFLTTIPAFFPSLFPAEIWVGLSLFQTIFDVQDNHNHAEFIYRRPVVIDGTTRKASLLVIEGINDSLVPNHATDSLAFGLWPLPHLEPVQKPVPFLVPTAGPLQGNIDLVTTAAFFQYVPDGVPGIPATPGCLVLSTRSRFEGHYCAQGAAESLKQRVDFFQSALVGVPVIASPFTP
jgi:hypothetical protein